MALQVGDIVEGKVTGIKPFGAFVSLPEGKTGLVHISEVSYEFVQDLSTVLSDGQTVSVKVISIHLTAKLHCPSNAPSPHRSAASARRAVSITATAVTAAVRRAPSARKSPASGSPNPPPHRAK